MTRLLLLALALNLTASVSVVAQNILKRERPTEIQSVRLNVQNDGDRAYFLFSEDVVLTATNMLVECDRLEVFATRQAEGEAELGKYGAIQEIVASGNVRIVQEERVATCERAVVQPNQERIVLTGSPVVEQPGGRLVTTSHQDEIILDRGNGKITVNSTGPNRIRLIGPAIGDLGFEQKERVPIPDEVIVEDQESGEIDSPAEAPAKNDQGPSAEEQPSDSASSENSDTSGKPQNRASSRGRNR